MTPTPEAVARHPHLAERLQPGWVRVDCHSHTMWSGDSTTTPEELEEGIRAAGIDVLCITDHNATNGAFELAHKLPCRVIVGEEIKTHHGEVIGLFLKERIPFGLPSAEVATRIRNQGGIVYIPHPFDQMRTCMTENALDDLVGRGLVDAMEGLNGKTSLRHLNERAARYASDAGVPIGGGSDAHVPDAIGAAYIEMPDFDGPKSFLEAMHQGNVIGHHFDAPRRWRARIVPSVSDIS